MQKVDEEYEPELNPEYIKKLDQLEKQTPIHIGTVDDLRMRYGL